ncbi:hypothetical protein MVES1_003877 [Malassezia vespertilionis]|nr:uncharacterized protein MVES1_003877 [Malassezia vespertilionis]WFD08501.1 hypothetical protein MVES1_003877 [Malassezia vespertilionis]
MFLGESLFLIPLLFRYLQRQILQRRDDASEPLLDDDTPISVYGAAAPRAKHTAHFWKRIVSGANSLFYDESPRSPKNAAFVSKDAFLFLFPAVCDICATTLINAALVIMPASICQMTRGSLVLFVGILSVVFLGYHLRLYQWVSLLLVMLGVALVGLSSIFVYPEHSFVARIVGTADTSFAAKVLLGVAMVLLSQVLTAMQSVWEEKVMSDFAVRPTTAVALEGAFGTAIVLVCMPLLHYTLGAGTGGSFDMAAGWRQIVENSTILWSMLACALSIALFNMFGLNVTRLVSATSRSTIDTLRTLGITALSMAFGWEVLQPLSGAVQFLGFACLVYGSSVFNNVVAPPFFLFEQDAQEHADRL